ncbi:hypothetical protein GTP45_11710 [Pseudoduganella sp. FT55W]|uniref:Uncharacterized protein n=1 Tax=Duganella rivi TaxID=2666083 RepID=A0A7X4KBU3_9BURK|nr:hypothetical protein [Duganella rivi]MYM67495.1 hypothetical protein [Duganella rivi]
MTEVRFPAAAPASPVQCLLNLCRRPRAGGSFIRGEHEKANEDQVLVVAYALADSHVAAFLAALGTHQSARLGVWCLLDFGRDLDAGIHRGAGLALIEIAIAIVLVGLLLVFSPRAYVVDQLPAGAVKYMPLLKAEQQRLWPRPPVLLASLVEQKSCISLRSRGCWNPDAKLKTEWEEGAGVCQITRAYRVYGSTRFDALSDLRVRYGTELGALNWTNVYQRPDL